MSCVLTCARCCFVRVYVYMYVYIIYVDSLKLCAN